VRLLRLLYVVIALLLGLLTFMIKQEILSYIGLISVASIAVIIGTPVIASLLSKPEVRPLALFDTGAVLIGVTVALVILVALVPSIAKIATVYNTLDLFIAIYLATCIGLTERIIALDSARK